MTTSSHAKAPARRSRRWLLGGLAVAAVAGFAALGYSVFAQATAAAEPTIPAGVKFTSWADNGTGGQRVLQLVKGDMPATGAIVSGVVKTDTNCDPDAQNINHCNNVIALADGGEIEVVHNHAMMNFECLSPGQKLSLSRLDAGWVVAKDAQ